MKKWLIVVMMAVSGLLGASPASAQAPPVDPAFERDILRLIEITGAQKLGEQVTTLVLQQVVQGLSQQNPNAPPRMIEIVGEVTQKLFTREFPTLLPRLVVIYSQALSHDDVRGLIAFYETPLGRRLLAAMPAITQAGAEAGQEWAQRLAPQLQQELIERFKQEGVAK